MFWLGGFFALQVTTSTPDALCPPLAEARAAIEARVGEVRGEYRVEYALVHSDDAARLLKLLVLLDERPVLERELPLGQDGCQDAAQAMALVLERYFDAIESPASDTPEPKLEPVPDASRVPKSQNSTVARAADAGVVPPTAPASSRWRASAGALVDHELGPAVTLRIDLAPASLQLPKRLRWRLALNVTPFLSSLSESVREQPIRENTLQLSTSAALEVGAGSFTAWLGPLAQLRLQRAEGSSLEHEQAAYRSLPGLGGYAGLGWAAPGGHWSVGLGGALGEQLRSQSGRFMLRDTDGGRIPVLIPQAWFLEGDLSLALQL